MKHKITILAASALLLMAAPCKAQYNETNNLIYFADRTPQSNLLNPAFFPQKNTFYLSLPCIWTQLGLPLAIGDMAQYDPNLDKTVIDINNILNTLSDDSRIRLGLDVPVLGFGLKVGPVFVDAGFQLRLNGAFGMPITMINTLLNGNVGPNGDAIPEQVLLDGNLLNATFYSETSIGAGFKFPMIPLTIGVHAKLLSGIFNLQMDNTRISFETSEDFEEVRAKMYYELMASSLLPFDTTQDGLLNQIAEPIRQDPMSIVRNIFDVNNGNTGVAFDLGAKYELGPLSISASINDLSAGIHWQKNLISIVPTGGVGVISFSGMELTQILDNGTLNMDSIQDYISGKLNDMLPSTEFEGTDYWYNIPTKINLAANLKLGLFHAGLLLHGQFDRGLLSRSNPRELDLSDNVKNTFRFNTTLSAGINLFNWVELIVGSSFVYDGTPISFNNFLNPGIGIIFTPATIMQVYGMLDYTSSFYASEMKAFNIKVGTNILIGRGGKSGKKILF